MASSEDEAELEEPKAFVVPQLVQDYFTASNISFQEYFRFPEMQRIRNPVHEYFRLGAKGGGHWIEEGTLPIEEGDDGWVYLGAEHHELARIAVGKSGNPHYYAYRWGDSYVGPILRGSAAVLSASVHATAATLHVTSSLLVGMASLVYAPPPRVPPADAPLEDRFLEESVVVDGETWWFRIWVPFDVAAVREEHGGLPAFLLLHGFKECGWDNLLQTKSGLASNLMTSQKWASWFPGIVVLPQLPRRPWDERWWRHWREPKMQNMALACLDRAVQRFRADRRRMYCIGESLGAEGAWYLAAARSGLFAGVAGAAGSVEPYDWENWEWGEEPENYRKLADGIGRRTAVWLCHGGLDDFVPPEQSRRLAAALQESRTSSAVGALLGRGPAAEVVYKEYDDLHHHVWERAYWDDGMIQWLVTQQPCT